MATKKALLSLILLFSMFLSIIAGISPAHATEPEDFEGDEEGFIEFSILSEPPDEGFYDENELLDDDFEIAVATFDALVIEEEDVFIFSDDPIEAFVQRLYLYVLGRPHDEGGLQLWTNELRTRARTGAVVAHNFFFSSEFLSRNITDNNAYVDILYRAFMNRVPDAGGKIHWVGILDSGLPREDVFSHFVNSQEFNNICNTYGITRGSHTPPPGGLVKVFVTRLYREVLERRPDSGGLELWSNQLISGRITGAQAANSFVFSPERAQQNLSNTKFIELLYKALLGREADTAGRDFWVARLDIGFPRESIFASFVTSPEFDNICRQHGIIRGTYTPPAVNLSRAFVTRLYVHVLGRQPDEAGLNNWANAVSSSSAANVAHNFFFISGITAPNMTSDDFVRALYESLFWRTPGQNEIDSWLLQLDTGMSRLSLFNTFIYSPEFAALYRSLGLKGFTSDSYSYGGVRPFYHIGTRAGCTGVVDQGLRHIGHHPRPNTFTRYAGMNADWCAMFTNYVFDHTGNCALHSHAQHSAAKIRSWTCTTIMNTARGQGRWADGNYSQPAPGDWILFNWGHSWNTSQHIGIVTGHDGERVYYVDGNTGGSGANMVLHQSRLLTDGSIRGYVLMF